MPLRPAVHDAVRVACGAAGAAVTMALATGLHLWNLGPAARQGIPASYPAALVVIGLACYLFGAALMLRAERPGRLLLAAFLPTLLALELAGVSLLAWGQTVELTPDGTRTAVAVRTALTPAAALVWLAVSAAALGLAVLVRGGERAAWLPLFARRSGGPIRRAPLPAAATAVPRLPASMEAVALRQFLVQAPRMSVVLLMAVTLGAWSAWREVFGTGTFLAGGMPLMPLVFVGFFAPVLVWMDETAAATGTRRIPQIPSGAGCCMPSRVWCGSRRRC
jgi:hypothetical protein